MAYFILYVISVLLSLRVWQIALQLDSKPVAHLAWLCYIPITNLVVLLLGVGSIITSKYNLMNGSFFRDDYFTAK